MGSETETEKHLFMLCRRLNRAAMAPLPGGFRFRSCQSRDLEAWMAMPFDTEAEIAEHRGFMQAWFDRVYAPRAALFFERCTFVCDEHDRPVATAFVWPISLGITTFHWLKVARTHEGMGLGRAILSRVMQDLGEADYPVLLHTHPTCQRAVKLYSDFGFDLLSGERLGSRSNDLAESLPFLRQTMPPSAFDSLRVAPAPEDLQRQLAGEVEPEF